MTASLGGSASSVQANGPSPASNYSLAFPPSPGPASADKCGVLTQQAFTVTSLFSTFVSTQKSENTEFRIYETRSNLPGLLPSLSNAYLMFTSTFVSTQKSENTEFR